MCFRERQSRFELVKSVCQLACVGNRKPIFLDGPVEKLVERGRGAAF